MHRADVGLAFDGDADRCFVVDADGEPVSPSAITGLVAAREIGRARVAGERDVAVVAQRHLECCGRRGGPRARRHTDQDPRRSLLHQGGDGPHRRVFGGEHSAHYFRDFWFADTGMLAALHVLAALGEQDRPLAEIAHGYERYASSGEINSTVEDQTSVVDRCAPGRWPTPASTSWTG